MHLRQPGLDLGGNVHESVGEVMDDDSIYG